MAVPHRKFVAGDRDEALKMATGHSCKPLEAMRNRNEKIMMSR